MRTNEGTTRRAFLARCAAAGSLSGTASLSNALMAGQPPDSPASRVDPNVPTSPWSGVVSVVSDGSPYSGVAIGPRHILTASHVVGSSQPGQLGVVLNHTTPPQSVAVAGISNYPGAAFPYDDLALLQLAQPLPIGVATYAVVDVTQPIGCVITLVGYGASGSGTASPTVPASSSIKRVGRNVVDQVQDHLDASGRTSPFFVYDFDGPVGSGATGGPTLGNAVETVVAGGDSGSGSFVMIGNEPMLYGLNTVALSLNGVPLSTFGSGGAGLILGHKPYLDWLVAQSADSVALYSRRQPDSIPAMPLWALAALGGSLWWSQRRYVATHQGQ